MTQLLGLIVHLPSFFPALIQLSPAPQDLTNGLDLLQLELGFMLSPLSVKG